MGTFGRYLSNRASAFLMVAVCTACGSSDKDTIEFTGGAAGALGDGGSSQSGSGNVDADGGTDSSPCEVAFINPVASDGGVLTLGGADDVDGTACGSEFSTSVLVSSNASTVKLFVNGASNSDLEQPVANLAATFASVQLGNRGSIANTVRAVATMADGRTCEVDLGTEVFVDCDGPSCSITQPANNVSYLNASDDVSGDTGFQTTVVVETSSETAGQQLQLTLDGNLDEDHQRSAPVVDESGQGVATFSELDLEEGARSLQATCRDALGNVVRSPRVDFTVDTTPCVVQVPALADLITPGADTGGAPGIQIAVSGTIDAPNADCAKLALGICSSLTDNDFNILSSSSGFTQAVTLPSITQANDVCARVQDLAGNVGEAQVTANVRVNAPQVAINSPADPANFTALTDEDSNTGTCEVDFSVDCEDVGSSVQLLEGNTPRASANCDADGNVSLPFHGRATFNNVVLASRNDGSTVAITARQTAADLVGTDDVTLGLDCQAPQPSFANSVPCGGIISVTGDDNQPAPGVQFTVGVINDGAPDVVLTITRGGSPVEVQPDPNAGSSTFFTDANLGDVGLVTLSACATDGQGNVGCVTGCDITIAAVPAVAITSPADNAILTTDCDTSSSNGFQVRVQGTTDAADGSLADFTVGSATTPGIVINGGAFDECVNAGTDGPSKTITVAITDPNRGLGSDSITVTLDSQAPTQSISTLVAQSFQRRQGIAHFSWTAVADEGGGPFASYEMRCDTATIDDETKWTDADVFTVNVAPAASGTQTDDIGGFRVGTTHFCVLRGRDFGGTLTPLPVSNATVTNAFAEQVFTVPDILGNFASVAPIGDINGDTFPDLIYGALNTSARVFFGNGGGTAPNGTHDIEITGLAGGFAAVVAGLGDISGDQIPDFAVSARALTGSRGAVYVFFGKAANTWNSSLTVNATDCGDADICFLGSEASAFLGWDMTSADVNGDNTLDLVLAARQRSTVGRVYVVLGGTQLGVGNHTAFDLPGAAATLNGFIIDPPASTSNFGIAVASVGGGNLVIAANGGVVGNSQSGRAFFATTATHTGTGLLAYPGTLSQFDTGATIEFAAQARPIGNFTSTMSGAVALGGSFNVGGIAQVYPSPFTFSTVLNFFNDGADNDWSSNIGASLHPDPDLGLVGDLDKDTFAELAVGSFETGSLELFYGGDGAPTCGSGSATGRCRSQADYHRNSAGVGQMYPNFVGDINGDGFNDLAVIDFGASITDSLTILY